MHSVNCCLQGGGASTAYINNEPVDWPPTVLCSLQCAFALTHRTSAKFEK